MKTKLGRDSSRSISWISNDLILVLVFVMAFVAETKLVEDPSQFAKSSSKLDGYDPIKLSEAINHLRKLNKPAVKSIQSPDGDIIDCIDREKQLAFDHPLLKNHKIQDPPQTPSISTVNENRTSFDIYNIQSWHINGDCPDGTIPVRRIFIEDLMREVSPQQFGKKDQYTLVREYAAAQVSGTFNGAQATVNVWTPVVEKDEFSGSAVLASNVHANLVAGGWQVNPKLFGDGQPRLFSYWTADTNHQSGCYNLLCPGFVHTSKNIALGFGLHPVSTFNGQQFDVNVKIIKDLDSGNWLFFFQGELIGYWPSEILPSLNIASTVAWGGEVINLQANGQHTSTQMGSGHFPAEGFGKSSYFRDLQIVDDKYVTQPVYKFHISASNPKCYNIKRSKSSGDEFFYGGPGRNSDCP